MSHKSDSDRTFCSIIEPSQEAVRVVLRNRKNRFKWNKFHTAHLRSRKKPLGKPPSECSEILITNSELVNSQVESQSVNRVAIVEPDEVVPAILPLPQEPQYSPGIVLATQCSNKPRRSRPQRVRPRRQVECGVQTSPVTSNIMEINELQVEKLSKKLKLNVDELKTMLKQIMIEDDGNETSETDSVISNSQKSLKMTSRPRGGRSSAEQQCPPLCCVPILQKSDSQPPKPLFQMPERVSPKPETVVKTQKPLSQTPKPAFLHPPPMRTSFTPVPATPERHAALQHRVEFTISPKTYKELTQSPTSRISRVKLNFSTVQVSPNKAKWRKPAEKFSKEWDSAFTVRPAKHRRILLFDDNNKVQSNQCTSTVFDDGCSLFDGGDNDKFFLDDPLDLLFI